MFMITFVLLEEMGRSGRKEERVRNRHAEGGIKSYIHVHVPCSHAVRVMYIAYNYVFTKLTY